MMKGLTLLRKKLLESNTTQKSLAESSGIATADISLIASGRLVPTPFQAKVIAEVLKEDVKALFPRIWA